MERPQAEWLIEFLEKAGKLKSVPRHCITPEGVRETVAGHCWRVSLMAWLLKEELPDVDMEKVIHMPEKNLVVDTHNCFVYQLQLAYYPLLVLIFLFQHNNSTVLY